MLGALKSSTKKVDVVIIGAGAAGLSCAQRLSNSGITNIVILEAQKEAGGRISTIQFGDFILELGAQWIHGEDRNLLFDYAKEYDLLADPVLDISHEKMGYFCTSSGETVPDSLVDEVILFLDNVKETISDPEYNHTEEPARVTEIFHTKFEEYILSCNDTLEIKKFKYGIYDWYMRFEIIDNACDKLEDITTLGYAEWKECPGIFHLNFKNGFKSFIESLSKQIPPGSIILSKPVKCVHWNEVLNKNNINCVIKDENNDFFPAIVECVDGEYILAKSVIVTVSVGYLKSNIKKFFKPRLPEFKRKAFMNLGFGTIDKIYLVFSEPFWEKNDLGFQLVWTDDYRNLKQFSMPETSWVRGISGFDIVRKQPNILVGWIGGLEAKKMETINEETVGKTCVHLLRKFLNRQDIPYPIQVIRSCWHSNEYIKGAYSNRPKQFHDEGCTFSDLTEPLFCSYSSDSEKIIKWPVVMFAGEATDNENFSAVHGAVRSGWREADRLIQFFKSNISSCDGNSTLESGIPV